MVDDLRETAAQYRVEQEARVGETEVAASGLPPRGLSELERAAYVETAIQ